MHVAIETHRSRWSPEHRYVSAREWKHGCSHAHFFMFTSLNVNFMLTLLEHAHMLDCRALFDMEEVFQHEGVVAGGGDVDVLWTRTNVRFYFHRYSTTKVQLNALLFPWAISTRVSTVKPCPSNYKQFLRHVDFRRKCTHVQCYSMLPLLEHAHMLDSRAHA